MTVRIRIQSEATPILRQMAKEAGVQLHDLCEIAVYNLMALWIKDRKESDDPWIREYEINYLPVTQPLDPHDGVVPTE